MISRMRKSPQSTRRQREGARFSMRGTDGKPRFPINDCSDVEDAWGLRGNDDNIEGGQEAVERHIRRAANVLGCSGPWDDDDEGKSLEALAVAGLPRLEGPEAVHNRPLRAAMAAVAELYQQEQAEDEPDCMEMLNAIGEQLLAYAQQEAAEYGDGSDDDQPDDMSAAVVYASLASPPGLIWKAVPAVPAVVSNEGRISALVNSTNVRDRQDDVCIAGCWQAAAKAARKPRVLLNHDHQMLPVGKVLSLKELMPGDPYLRELSEWHFKNGAGALLAEMQVNLGTEAGRDFFNSVQGGYLDEWSIGAVPDESSVNYRNGVREIGSWSDLIEISGVLMGASPETVTLATKGSAAAAERLDWTAVLAAFVAEAHAEPSEYISSFVAAASKLNPELSAWGQRMQLEAQQAANEHTSFAVWERERDPRSTTSGGSYCGLCQVSGHSTQDCSKTQFSRIRIPYPPSAWPNYQDRSRERFLGWMGID